MEWRSETEETLHGLIGGLIWCVILFVPYSLVGVFLMPSLFNPGMLLTSAAVFFVIGGVISNAMCLGTYQEGAQ